MTPQKLIWPGIFGICLIALAAVLIFAAQISEFVPHSEDEVAYIFQARVFAQNRLAVPTPPLPAAFWSPFVLDYRGQRFGKYPPGWPLLLSLGVRVGQPWLVNALLGSVTLFGLAWLARCFYCDQKSTCWPALLAAALGLATPGFLFLSGSLLSHAASLFWVTLTLISLTYSVETHRSLPALLAGVFLGAAFVTRPFAAIGVGLALFIFLLMLVARGHLPFLALLWLPVGTLVVAALSPLYWWAVTGNPLFNAYLLVWPYDRLGFGPDVGPLGFTLHDAIFINLRLKLSALATGLFGWPGWTNLIFLPIPFVTRRAGCVPKFPTPPNSLGRCRKLGRPGGDSGEYPPRPPSVPKVWDRPRRANRWDWLLLGVIVSLMFVHLFYWAYGGDDGGFPRYYYDALPAFVLLTVRGIAILADGLARWRSPLRWLPLVLVAIFIAYNIVWNLPPRLAEQKGKYGITPTSLAAVAQANLPKPALILVENVKSWNDFAAPFAANSPTLDGPILFAIDNGDGYTPVLRASFPNRSCWQLTGTTLTPCPPLSEQVP